MWCPSLESTEVGILNPSSISESPTDADSQAQSKTDWIKLSKWGLAVCRLRGISGNSLRVEQNGAKFWRADSRAGRVCGSKTSWKKALERLISYCGPHLRPALHLKPVPADHTPMSSEVQPSKLPQPGKSLKSLRTEWTATPGTHCAHVRVPLELRAATRRCQVPGKFPEPRHWQTADAAGGAAAMGAFFSSTVSAACELWVPFSWLGLFQGVGSGMGKGTHFDIAAAGNKRQSWG